MHLCTNDVRTRAFWKIFSFVYYQLMKLFSVHKTFGFEKKKKKAKIMLLVLVETEKTSLGQLKERKKKYLKPEWAQAVGSAHLTLNRVHLRQVKHPGITPVTYHQFSVSLKCFIQVRKL